MGQAYLGIELWNEPIFEPNRSLSFYGFRLNVPEPLKSTLEPYMRESFSLTTAGIIQLEPSSTFSKS